VLDHKKKEELIARFDKLAAERETWIRRDRYYCEDQTRYYRFLVSEGLSILEPGCGAGDLLPL